MSGKKVVVAGHTCIDITPRIGGDAAKSLGERLTPGKLLAVGDAAIYTGGTVANTGLAMKLLGNEVYLAGKIGDDAFGDMVEAAFERYGAAEGLIRKKGESTSYTLVLAVPGIDRVFLHHAGANDTFISEDLRDELLSGTTLFHFGYPPLMKKMYEDSGEELFRVLKKAKDAGAVTSLDLAAVDPESEAGKADWKAILERALPVTDIFVPSVEELCYMLDREMFHRISERAGAGDFCELLDPEKDIAPLAEKALELGARLVMIKCGAPGLYLATAGKDAMKPLGESLGLDICDWADRRVFLESYVPERVLSGTGAGDTCIAAFLTAILEGEACEMCLKLAAGEGASTVAAYDALGGLRTLPELKEKIACGWAKNERRERKC